MTQEQIKLLKEIDSIRVKAVDNPESYPQDYLVRLIQAVVSDFFDSSIDRNKLDKLMQEIE